MPRPTPGHHPSPSRRLLLVGIAAAWLAIAIGSRVVVPPLLLAAFDGESIAWLNGKIAAHRAGRAGQGLDASREWYQAWAYGYATKASALATLGLGVAALAVGSAAARRRVRRYVLASASPLNLGVLRAAAFGALFYLLSVEPILTYAAWPAELYVYPFLAEPAYRLLPPTVALVTPMLAAGKVAALCAAAGLMTRVAAPLAVVVGAYLLGVPQLSGKVNHLHHVLLVGAIVALSRSGDAFSLDSLWRAILRADRGVVAPPRPAVRYGMPIRVAMLVLATVYFFPGFWKVASNGPQWVFSGNLENHMLQKWFELEHYTPPIPLHEAPFSGPMGALFAVVFELGFPFALFWRPTRALWGILGITFHNLTNLLMKISFVSLQVLYVMFVDWARLLRWAGRCLLGPPMRILYDGECGLCRRTLAVLGAIDWLGQLRPVRAIDRRALARDGLGHLEEFDLLTDMHAAWRRGDSAPWSIARGYASYQALAWRVPLLWPIAPVLLLPPVAWAGRAIYRRVADSRACRVPTSGRAAPPLADAPRWRWRPLAAAATLILATQCLLGLARIHKSWPLACYPLFDQIATRTVFWPEFEAVGPAGVSTPLDDDPIRDALGDARYVESMRRLVAAPLDEADALRTLARFAPAWRAAGLLPAETPASLRVWRSEYALSGPSRPAAPVRREPLMTAPWREIEHAGDAKE